MTDWRQRLRASQERADNRDGIYRFLRMFGEGACARREGRNGEVESGIRCSFQLSELTLRRHPAPL